MHKRRPLLLLWKRHALRVQGKYENDTWLGAGMYGSNNNNNKVINCSISNTGGRRTNSFFAGEWPVSCHGTQHGSAHSIAEQGCDLSKSRWQMYGKGVYSSPSIKVAARYATKFHYNDKRYKVVFQNTTRLKVFTSQETNHGEYRVQPNQELVRPYGLCIKDAW